jgi:hypothetical protein
MLLIEGLEGPRVRRGSRGRNERGETAAEEEGESEAHALRTDSDGTRLALFPDKGKAPP